jgi:dihydrofolate reductase
MSLSLIVAIDEQGAIGRNNQLLWHLPADLNWFKQQTLGKPVVMGRKTYDSIGRPLPKRRNIVISRNTALEIPEVERVQSLQSALSLVENEAEVMVIGGGQIYREALPFANKLYLTRVATTVADADTFFPQINFSEWSLSLELTYKADEKNGFDMRFQVWDRRANA